MMLICVHKFVESIDPKNCKIEDLPTPYRIWYLVLPRHNRNRLQIRN